MFNIIGPLTNPARPYYQLLGIYDESLLEPLAAVLSDLGVKRGLVVYGQDKMDEISLSAPTSVCAFVDGWMKKFTITPQDYGFRLCRKEDLRGGTPEENAEIFCAALRE